MTADRHAMLGKEIILRLILIAVFIIPQLLLEEADAETGRYSKPNIIFIMADDLGKLLLPIYGAKPIITMPHLNRLAEEGVVFKNTYATPVCFSTRAKLLSGRSALNTGAYANEFPYGSRTQKYLNRVVSDGRATGFYKYFYKGDSNIHPFIDLQYTPSFALPIRDAGYSTAIVGKWHLNDEVKQPRIFKRYGFDRWMLSGGHRNMGAYTDKGFIATPGFLPEKMADFVIDFIEENQDNSFFVYYPMHLIHAGYVATPLNPQAKTTEEKVISMIEYVDLIIGRITKTLEELNLKDRTIIFFSGDNGDVYGYPLLYKKLGQKNPGKQGELHRGKGTLYEGGVNVPLIVSGGPVIRRGETEALVDFTDILPTLADFAGVSVVKEKQQNNNDYRGILGEYISVAGQYKGDGQSIAPFLTGQAEDTARNYIMFVGKRIAIIRDKRFKLWASIKEDSENKLYDLYEDADEQINLYNSRKPIVAAARQRLEYIANRLPERTDISMQFDPVDWNYGMLAHWSMDSQSLTNAAGLADSEGGYDAESNSEIIFNQQGKFGEAIEANHLHSPYSNGLFYNFIMDSNNRLYNHLVHLSNKKIFIGSRTFFAGVHSFIRNFNQTSLELTNTIYNWINPDEYFSRRGDRKKFLTSMTVSAWLQTQQPAEDINLLMQPYIGKEGRLMNFSITDDAAVSFELTANDEARKLESETLDGKLWGRWIHIAATWDGRDDCGETTLYVNGESVDQACLGTPLSADDSDNLLLGGFSQSHTASNAKVLVDDIAIWRQPLLPLQIEAIYKLGERFSYNASEVDALFNTPEENGVTKINDDIWRRSALTDTADVNRLIIRELADRIEIQFGKVMAISM